MCLPMRLRIVWTLDSLGGFPDEPRSLESLLLRAHLGDRMTRGALSKNRRNPLMSLVEVQ